jgi:hypothetical protein
MIAAIAAYWPTRIRFENFASLVGWRRDALATGFADGKLRINPNAGLFFGMR